MNIQHGIPAHPYFAICQPPSVGVPNIMRPDQGTEKPVYELQDPKTGQTVKAELQDVATVTLDELERGTCWSLLLYGLEAKKLTKVLQQRYPEIEETKTIHILFLKKL